MIRMRYPLTSLLGDYARAVLGAGFVAIPLVVTDLPIYLFLFFAILLLVFAIYGLRTLNRQLTSIEFDDNVIRAVGGLAAEMRWDDLEAVSLRYFSTRRDRQGGWLHLRLDGGERSIRVDSAIDGFQDLAAMAYKKAQQKGISLNSYSLNNFASLGLGNGPAEDFQQRGP